VSFLAKNLLMMGAMSVFGARIISAQMPVQFGVGGGVTVPSGSTNNGLKTGWHGTALIQLRPASTPAGLRIDGAYQQLGFDGGDGKRQIIEGTGNVVYELRVAPEVKFRPYLIGGGGVYNVKNKPDAGGTASFTKFGLNAGAGFNIVTSGMGLFVEGRFHNVFVPGSDFHFIPITLGIRFGGT
jgi:opacity protein-like surface antigen